MNAAMGTLDILVIALGERLGYYRLLAGREPLTPPGWPPRAAPRRGTQGSGSSSKP